MPDYEYDLSSFISGPSGFLIVGDETYNNLGYSVNNIYDVNGDNIDDIIYSSYGTNTLNRGYSTGTSYVLFGKANNDTDSFFDNNNYNYMNENFTTNNNIGYKIYGAYSYSSTGYTVSKAGDFNNDGINDILIGAPQATFQLMTTTSSRSSSIDSSSDSDSDITYVNNHHTDSIDINIDTQTSLSRIRAGVVYVIFGFNTSDGIHNVTDIDLLSFQSSNLQQQQLQQQQQQQRGFTIYGANSYDSISSLTGLSSAGDFNNDNIDDIMISAYFASYNNRVNCGVVYIIYGNNGDSFSSSGSDNNINTRYYNDIDLLSYQGGLMIVGSNSNDYTGRSISGGNDVNADYIDDIVIAAYKASPLTRDQAGIVYVIYGSSTKYASSSSSSSSSSSLQRKMIDLKNFMSGNDGYRIFGVNANDNYGFSVSIVSDMNGDDINEIVLSSLNASPMKSRKAAGTVYVLFGQKNQLLSSLLVETELTTTVVTDPLTTTSTTISTTTTTMINSDSISSNTNTNNDIDLKSFITSNNNGFKIFGAMKNDNLGYSINSIGDFNNDGYHDVVISSIQSTPTSNDNNDNEVRTKAGSVYIIYGHNSTIMTYIDIDLNSMTKLSSIRNKGYQFIGRIANDKIGISLSSAGDFNHDGIDDIMIGCGLASYNNDYVENGMIYIIYGNNITYALNISSNAIVIPSLSPTSISLIPSLSPTSITISSSSYNNHDKGKNELYFLLLLLLSVIIFRYMYQYLKFRSQDNQFINDNTNDNTTNSNVNDPMIIAATESNVEIIIQNIYDNHDVGYDHIDDHDRQQNENNLNKNNIDHNQLSSIAIARPIITATVTNTEFSIDDDITASNYNNINVNYNNTDDDDGTYRRTPDMITTAIPISVISSSSTSSAAAADFRMNYTNISLSDDTPRTEQKPTIKTIATSSTLTASSSSSSAPLSPSSSSSASLSSPPSAALTAFRLNYAHESLSEDISLK
jgi:hypothetical protein